MKPNIAFVGPAGIGKTTLAKCLVENEGYRRHALADALKVGQAFIVYLQLNLPLLDSNSVLEYLPNVKRIMSGKMGTYDDRTDATQHHWIYKGDILVRDAFLDFVNENKVEMRGLLQQYGTEVIRGIGGKFYPDREGTENEVWLSIVLNEARNDNKLGIPVVCDDVRYPHEAEAFRKNGWEIVRVNRTDATKGIGITDENIKHSSEQMHTRIKETFTYVNEVPLEMLANDLHQFAYRLSAISE